MKVLIITIVSIMIISLILVLIDELTMVKVEQYVIMSDTVVFANLFGDIKTNCGIWCKGELIWEYKFNKRFLRLERSISILGINHWYISNLKQNKYPNQISYSKEL